MNVDVKDVADFAEGFLVALGTKAALQNWVPTTTFRVTAVGPVTVNVADVLGAGGPSLAYYLMRGRSGPKAHIVGALAGIAAAKAFQAAGATGYTSGYTGALGVPPQYTAGYGARYPLAPGRWS